jgi:hypothetical protein
MVKMIKTLCIVIPFPAIFIIDSKIGISPVWSFGFCLVYIVGVVVVALLLKRLNW